MGKDYKTKYLTWGGERLHNKIYNLGWGEINTNKIYNLGWGEITKQNI